jgi:hypothetical protein
MRKRNRLITIVLLFISLSSTQSLAYAEPGCTDYVIVNTLINVPFVIFNSTDNFFTGHFMIDDLPIAPC